MKSIIKKIIGWILIIWGCGGMFLDLFIVAAGMAEISVIMILRTLVAIAFIFIGYNLVRKKEAKPLDSKNTLDL